MQRIHTALLHVHEQAVTINRALAEQRPDQGRECVGNQRRVDCERLLANRLGNRATRPVVRIVLHVGIEVDDVWQAHRRVAHRMSQMAKDRLAGMLAVAKVQL